MKMYVDTRNLETHYGSSR